MPDCIMKDRAKLIIRDGQRSLKTYTVVINGVEEEVFDEYSQAISYIEDQGFDQSQIRVIDES